MSAEDFPPRRAKDRRCTFGGRMTLQYPAPFVSAAGGATRNSTSP